MILSLLQNAFDGAIGKVLQGFSFTAHVRSEVTQSTKREFGHYQCNSALKLSKILKKNPREVAQDIVQFLDPMCGNQRMIARMEIAGAGFINITLEPTFIATRAQEMLLDARLGIPLPKKPEKIIVEFSSPNIAKELHVGHLRSTIIGDALARLLEFVGHHVLRLNHVGDWGTQFGMLIAYMKEMVPHVLTGKETTDITQLMEWYRLSKKRFDEDPEFKKRAREEVVALQGGNAETKHAWQIICDISRHAFQEIYDLLDIRIQERGESFYNPFLAQIVEDLERKGLLSISEGAKCVFLEGFVGRDGTPQPMIVQKSDGGYNYETTDVAAMWHRVAKERAERIVVVTDAGQSLHFDMVYQTAVKAGYLDPQKVRFDHVTFGVVLGPDGKKFKTRSGDAEKLIDLLLEAISRARSLIKERLPDLSANEMDEYSRILGVDAIKYADLSCHRQKDYIFSYEKMLRFEGNTAPFLLYAYVRIQGIKRKINKNLSSILGTPMELSHPTEEMLALHACQFGEILDMVTRDLLPNRLAEYLYELAEKFHAFFRDCRVEGSPQEASRIQLCEVTGRVLEKGLTLLGLKVLPKM